ncbi:hypothetical protein HDU76_013422 [Blyttiomyces sp. JEL0837]|nr:hypothetical protein HDU76_013422 [Blyttiomyces sp. JEL0837]
MSSPFIGSLSDKYGRKNVLLISMIGNAISMGLWIFSKSFLVFVMSRVVGGLTEGNVQMSIAMISDITTPETRSRGLALVGIAFSLGFTVGPPIGAYFASLDLLQIFPFLKSYHINSYSSPALFAFVLIIIETVYMAVALPETLDFKKRVRERAVAARMKLELENETKVDGEKEGENESGLRKRKVESKKEETTTATTMVKKETTTPTPPQSTNTPILRQLSLLHFLFLFVFSGMEFTLTFLTHDRFQFSHAQQGRILGGMGVLAALVQGGYVRRYAHRVVSEKTMAIQGMCCCCIGLFVIGVFATSNYGSNGIYWLYVGAAFLAFTSGTVVTSLTSLASLEGSAAMKKVKGKDEDDGVKPVYLDGNEVFDEGSDQGRLLGKFRSMGQLGRSVGPLFSCSGYWILGSRMAYGIGAFGVALIAVFALVGLPKGVVTGTGKGGKVKSGKKVAFCSD